MGGLDNTKSGQVLSVIGRPPPSVDNGGPNAQLNLKGLKYKHGDYIMQQFFRLALLAIVVGLVAGCAGGPIYTIDKGDHSSGIHFSTHGGDGVHGVAYELKFDESCVYKIDGQNQFDWNKVGGRGYGFSHQNWSVRWGWRARPDGWLEINPYLHVDGSIVIPEVEWAGRNARTVGKGPVPIRPGFTYLVGYDRAGTILNFTVACAETGDYYWGWSVSDQYEEFDGCGYRLFPYFGGDEVAPHDMTMHLRELTAEEYNVWFNEFAQHFSK